MLTLSQDLQFLRALAREGDLLSAVAMALVLWERCLATDEVAVKEVQQWIDGLNDIFSREQAYEAMVILREVCGKKGLLSPRDQRHEIIFQTATVSDLTAYSLVQSFFTLGPRHAFIQAQAQAQAHRSDQNKMTPGGMMVGSQNSGSDHLSSPASPGGHPSRTSPASSLAGGKRGKARAGVNCSSPSSPPASLQGTVLPFSSGISQGDEGSVTTTQMSPSGIPFVATGLVNDHASTVMTACSTCSTNSNPNNSWNGSLVAESSGASTNNPKSSVLAGASRGDSDVTGYKKSVGKQRGDRARRRRDSKQFVMPKHESDTGRMARSRRGDRQAEIHSYCSVCHAKNQGLVAMCLHCGHGGHLRHIQEWFGSLDGTGGQKCAIPTCICHCVFQSNELYN